MTDADHAIYARAAATPHMTAETFAYYAGRNAAWAAISDGSTKVSNPHAEKVLRASFNRGVRHAAAEERLNLDAEWD